MQDTDSKRNHVQYSSRSLGITWIVFREKRFQPLKNHPGGLMNRKTLPKIAS